MTTIIIGLILLTSIGMLLVGLRMSMIVSIKNEEKQSRLNNRILDSLPEDFRLK